MLLINIYPIEKLLGENKKVRGTNLEPFQKMINNQIYSYNARKRVSLAIRRTAFFRVARFSSLGFT